MAKFKKPCSKIYLKPNTKPFSGKKKKICRQKKKKKKKKKKINFCIN